MLPPLPPSNAAATPAAAAAQQTVAYCGRSASVIAGCRRKEIGPRQRRNSPQTRTICGVSLMPSCALINIERWRLPARRTSGRVVPTLDQENVIVAQGIGHRIRGTRQPVAVVADRALAGCRFDHIAGVIRNCLSSWPRATIFLSEFGMALSGFADHVGGDLDLRTVPQIEHARDAHGASFDTVLVPEAANMPPPDAANMPPTPCETEILVPAI